MLKGSSISPALHQLLPPPPTPFPAVSREARAPPPPPPPCRLCHDAAWVPCLATRARSFTWVCHRSTSQHRRSAGKDGGGKGAVGSKVGGRLRIEGKWAQGRPRDRMRPIYIYIGIYTHTDREKENTALATPPPEAPVAHTTTAQPVMCTTRPPFPHDNAPLPPSPPRPSSLQGRRARPLPLTRRPRRPRCRRRLLRRRYHRCRHHRRRRRRRRRLRARPAVERWQRTGLPGRRRRRRR